MPRSNTSATPLLRQFPLGLGSDRVYRIMPPHAEVNREDSFPFKLRLLRWLGRQNSIPRGQNKLLRLGCNPDTCEPYGFEVDFFGLRYQGDLSEFLDWSVFMYGSYAYSEL